MDFVQSGDLQEHDPAIARKVSRISFRPRGPVRRKQIIWKKTKSFIMINTPQMQLLSHPLTPEELLDFTLSPIAVYAEYSVS